MSRLYFDYNATTPLAPSVVELLAQLNQADTRNPISSYFEGRKANQILEQARSELAQMLDCEPKEIVLTSGSTEANNTLVYSAQHTCPKTKFITSSVEHASVAQPLMRVAKQGGEVCRIAVKASGDIDWEAYREALDDRTNLVSFMLANNETGMIFPIAEMAALAHQKGALFHTDAVCLAGKKPISFKKLGVDFLTLSGHKFYAPPGCGLLLIKQGVTFEPLIIGGMQEQSRRAGTVNLPGLLSMSKGLEFALMDGEVENERLWGLRDQIKTKLVSLDSNVCFHEHAERDKQLPGTLNVSFKNLAAQTLLARLDLEGVAASGGSACHSGALEDSDVLLAMGYGENEVHGSIRISFGKMTTQEDVDGLLTIFEKILT